MVKIKSVVAREVLNSRGLPAVEAEVNGFRAIAPEGASKGKYEAVDIKDGGSRFRGLGVQRAVDNVNKIIAKKLTDMELDQESVDKILCSLAGSNKWKIGGNATTAVSIAVAKAIGDYRHIQKLSGSKPCVPVPFSLIVEGGAHADDNLAVQEFMIVPLNFTTFKDSIRAVSEIYQVIKEDAIRKFGKNSSNVGFEGGFALPLNETRKALSMIDEAIKEAGYSGKVKIALDAAATQFFRGKYMIDEKSLTAAQLADYYMDLAKIFPIVSIEDPFAEEDFDSFALLKSKARRLMIVGDDLTVTNPARIKKAIEKDSCNSLLVKINQIGTVSEAIDAANLARKAGWSLIVSHRGGDSEDVFIADFSVGLCALGAKFGAPCRGERTAKYNQLLRLEELGLPFAAKSFKL